VFTVSDTRVERDDTSGRAIRERLERAGHAVERAAILPDEPERVREAVRDAIAEDGCDGVLLTGGTGISGRDSTHEAIVGLLDKRLEGFGELFRWLSWQEIGSAAMLSRAVGGVASGKFVFAMPGSTAAVALAMDELIVPEIAHLLAELRKDA
jgi:molybdenum cofactor biosynthesis protein B